MTKINNMSATTNTNILKEETIMTTTSNVAVLKGQAEIIFNADTREKSIINRRSIVSAPSIEQYLESEEVYVNVRTMLGVTLREKASWINKNGTLSKSNREYKAAKAEYDRQVKEMQEFLSFYSRSEEALEERMKLGRVLTLVELYDLYLSNKDMELTVDISALNDEILAVIGREER